MRLHDLFNPFFPMGGLSYLIQPKAAEDENERSIFPSKAFS